MQKLFLFVAATLSIFSSKAQEDFIYTTEERPPFFIVQLNDKFVVEFPNGIQNSEGFEGIQISEKHYVVSDTQSVMQFSNNFKFRRAYSVSGRNHEIYESGELILQFKTSVSNSARDSIIDLFDLEHLSTGPVYQLYRIENSIEVSKMIFETGLVKFCHPNFFSNVKLQSYYPNDGYFHKQYYLHNTGQIINDNEAGANDADIDAPEVWDITKGDSNIVIAIIDEGVQKFHYDLPISRQIRLPKSNMNDINGTSVDDPEPYEVAMNCAHGNAVAGIAAATHDNGGVAGIAPNCKIMPIRIFGSWTTSDAMVANSIVFADTNGAHVISGSFGGGYLGPVVEAAMQFAISNNKFLVFAASNSANLAYLGDPGTVSWPAAYNIPGSISVGASDKYDSVAIYSPRSELIDIVAPSARGASCFQPWGSFPDVWTCDLLYTNGYNPWPWDSTYLIYYGDTIPWNACKSVPGGWGEKLPGPASDTFAQAFTGRMSGTSAAAPQVSAVAALMMSVNNCLTPTLIKKILQQTADKVGSYNYQWNALRPGHSKEMGFGRLNANTAVRAAKEFTSNNFDLFIRDGYHDVGASPNLNTYPFWESPDIWVRNSDDSIEIDENAEYSANSPVHVYVKIRNKSCVNSLGVGDSLILYWSKAGPYQLWPAPWFGINPATPPMGGKVAAKLIGSIPAGEFRVLKFEWNIPNPSWYSTDISTIGGVNNAWHFCLVARIKSATDLDPININVPQDIGNVVEKCNNVAWKNLAVVNFEPGVVGGRVNGTVVGIGNMATSPRTINVHFYADTTGPNNIVSEAEVILSLNPGLWEKWNAGGRQGTNVGVYNEEKRQIRITRNSGSLINLAFQGEVVEPLAIQFSFVTEEVTETKAFKYFVIQEHQGARGFEPDGGQTIVINRYERDLFEADGGPDQLVQKHQSVTLNAADINETATYNWYDENDSLIYSGKNLTITPEIESQYKLEVIADLDGFKSYDNINVDIKKNFILSVSPNPTSSYFTLSYHLEDVSSAYVMMTNGQYVSSHIIDIIQSQQQINVSTLTPGTYQLVLICDGQIADSKTISIN